MYKKYPFIRIFISERLMGKKRTAIELETIERVKKIRISRGYTQEALSFALGFERTAINKFERGIKSYNLNHLNALGKILKCSPREFLPEDSL